MRSIKNITLGNNGIIKSLNDNTLNLILTPRQWGLTTLLIDYINQIPNDKSILFGVANSGMISYVHRRITHPKCRIQDVYNFGLVGNGFDYIICDNFFDDKWIKKLVLIAPVLKEDGKIILADSGKTLEDEIPHFVNYNKIIKTS
jgi:hypothetical protein